MKFSIRGYWKPTPKVIRKISDFIFGLTIVASGIIAGADKDIISSDQKVRLMFYITSAGAVVKYTSNFFKDETPNTPDNL
jgi:hypothetical protein